MRALSIRQPWIWAIVEGLKPIENRSRRPPVNVIGQRIALHASRTDDMSGYEWLRANGFDVPNDADIHRGAIIATARVGDVFESHDSPWFMGPIAFELNDVRRVEAIPCSGALGFWEVSEETARKLEAADLKAKRESMFPHPA